MKSFALAGVVALVSLSLAGCNIQADIAKIDGTAQSALLKANLVLAREAPTVGAFIAQHVAQADTYFQQIAATGVLSPGAVAAERAAVSKANAYAANTPTTVAGVAQDLATIFSAIQNLSTVPGS